MQACLSRKTSVTVRASGGSYQVGNNNAFAIGQTVKVVKPIKVFSVPKHPEGLDLEGMKGVVFKNASEHKGKSTSATLPFVVKFETQLDGKPVKFQAHLADDELAAA